MVEGSGARLISTGAAEIDRKIGGGLPLGSLTLLEGRYQCGKTALLQRMVSGALYGGFNVVVYTNEGTARTVLREMEEANLDLTDYFLLEKLTIYALPPPAEDGKYPALSPFLDHIRSLCEHDLIVVDSLTPFIRAASEADVLSFFEACKDYCNQGVSALFSVHSHVLDDSMFVRLRTICDAYFRVRVAEMGRRLVNVLEAVMVREAEKSTGNIVTFVVEPGIGVKILPFSRSRGG